MVQIKLLVAFILPAAVAQPVPDERFPIATEVKSLSADPNEHLPSEDDRTPLLPDKVHAPPRPIPGYPDERFSFGNGVKTNVKRATSKVKGLFACPREGYIQLSSEDSNCPTEINTTTPKEKEDAKARDRKEKNTVKVVEEKGKRALDKLGWYNHLSTLRSTWK